MSKIGLSLMGVWGAILLGSTLTASSEIKGAPTQKVCINEVVWEIQVVSTVVEKQQGLMGYTFLDPLHGMLFVYSEPQVLHFWMKDTYLPLSIAFIDEQGVIFQITDLHPLDLTIVTSSKAASYALEVNQGEFTKEGVKQGDVLVFLE